MRQFKGHAGGVLALAVTSDGRHIVTGSDDNTARVWDAGTGVELLQLKVPGAVRGVAVTPDGTRIVTGSDDNIARVWDAGNGTELRQFKGHAESLLAVAAMPDGRRIVTGSDDKTARVWDVEHRSPTASDRWYSRLPKRGSHTGRLPDHHRFGRQYCAVMGRQQWSRTAPVHGSQGPVTAVTAMLGGDLIVTGSEDSTVADMERCHWRRAVQARWPHASRHERRRHAGQRSHHHRFEGQDRTGMGHQNRHRPALAHGTRRAVLAVAVTPDGSNIVTGTAGSTSCRVWDRRSGAETG